jgi:hypothetical protein
MRKLQTARDVISHLGGLKRVCEITGANRKQAEHWRGRAASFPASTYVVMMQALRRRRATAPPQLWNMRGFDDAA